MWIWMMERLGIKGSVMERRWREWRQRKGMGFDVENLGLELNNKIEVFGLKKKLLVFFIINYFYLVEKTYVYLVWNYWYYFLFNSQIDFFKNRIYKIVKHNDKIINTLKEWI